MASGKIHAKVSRRIGLVGAVGIMVSINHLAPSLAFLFGARAGVYLTPDLDVNRKIHANYVLIKKHPFLGRVFYWYWKPYALIVRHRSWMSHPLGNEHRKKKQGWRLWSWVLPTVIRVVYLFIWLVPLVVMSLPFRDFLIQFANQYSYEIKLIAGWWFLGLLSSDLGHAVYDSKLMRLVLKFRR